MSEQSRKLTPVVFESVFNELAPSYQDIIRSSLPNIAFKQLVLNMEREYATILGTLDLTLAAEDFQMRYVAVKQMQLCMQTLGTFINQLGELQ